MYFVYNIDTSNVRHRSSFVYTIDTLNCQTQVILSIQYTYPQLGDIDGIHTGMGTISITE